MLIASLIRSTIKGEVGPVQSTCRAGDTVRFTIEARDQHGNLANYPPLDRVKYDFKVTVSGPGAVRAPIGMHVQLILASAPCRAHTRKAA